MSTAQMHPATVQQSARNGFATALALIALAALAIVAFALGQGRLSVGGATTTQIDDSGYRQQRAGEITTGAPVVRHSPTDIRLRRASPAALEAQRARLAEPNSPSFDDPIRWARAAAQADALAQSELRHIVGLDGWGAYSTSPKATAAELDDELRALAGLPAASKTSPTTGGFMNR